MLYYGTVNEHIKLNFGAFNWHENQFHRNSWSLFIRCVMAGFILTPKAKLILGKGVKFTFWSSYLTCSQSSYLPHSLVVGWTKCHCLIYLILEPCCGGFWWVFWLIKEVRTYCHFHFYISHFQRIKRSVSMINLVYTLIGLLEEF